jgi:hypothetical protein
VDGNNGNGRRFQPGNPGGPGRPKRAHEQAYLDAVICEVPLEDWHKIIAKAKVQAMNGDAKARDWLSKHLIGNDPILVVNLVNNLTVEFELVKAQLDIKDARIADLERRLQDVRDGRLPEADEQAPGLPADQQPDQSQRTTELSPPGVGEVAQSWPLWNEPLECDPISP